jgi:hypothetical protein
VAEVVRFPLAMRVLSARFGIRCRLSVRLHIEGRSTFADSFLVEKSRFRIADHPPTVVRYAAHSRTDGTGTTAVVS